MKSKRITNNLGNVVSAVELDPWGGETTHSSNLNQAFQPKKFTSYIRDAIGSDDAMHRRYDRGLTRFQQPDPYNGSYDLTNPQSFNRYAYVQNDPINFVDPLGLDDDDLGPPPPVPTLIPFGGRIVTNTRDTRYTGGGILDNDGNSIPEEGPEADGGLGGLLANPQNSAPPCTFNINISGVSGQQLTDMQNEISRIFASGGFNVVFDQPGLASGGSVNLAVTDQFFGAIARDIGPDLNNRGRLGRTLGSDAQVNSANIFNAMNRGSIRLLRPTTTASYGTMFGRIGAHEAIAHALLGSPVHPFNLQPDIRNLSLIATLAARYNSQWNIAEDTANALRAKCP